MKNNLTNKSKIFYLSLLTAILLFCAAVDFSQMELKDSKRCQPNVKMSSILDGIRVDGTLRIGELYVECLSMPQNTASKYVFEPYQGAKFTSNLKNSSGRIVNSFVWYGEKYFQDVVKMTRYEIVGGNEALQELTAGDYRLEFAIDDKVFQSFPFSVSTKKSNDIYRPGIIYMLEGAWRDEAYLTSPSPDNIMCFNFRLRADYDLADIKPANIPFELKMFRDKDNKLVAKNRDVTLKLENSWQTYRTCFVRADDEPAKAYSTLKLSEIMAVDGKYTINLSYNGKPYATYKFDVRERRINGEDLPARNIRVILPANILRK